MSSEAGFTIERRHVPGEQQAASGEGIVSEVVISVLTAQMLVLIYLQKFSINISEDFQVSIPLIFAFASLAWLGSRQAIRFEPKRVVLYCILVASAALSQSLGTLRISYSSIFLLILLYATFTLNWRAGADQIARVADRFSILMIGPAILVLVQFAYELYFGAGNSLSLERYVPRSLLLGGYVYESSTESWVTWNRPNGLIFLEPSFCSAFLACAAINELQLARRYFRGALFLVSLLATAGATGFVMLAIAAPVIAVQKKPVWMIFAGLLGLFGVISVLAIRPDLLEASRWAEMSDPSSSGYGRLFLPIETLMSLLLDPRFLISGYGAGQLTAELASAWPITKLSYEYGVATAAAYFAFCIVSMYGSSNVALRLAFFMVFQFTGGYLLSPFLVLLIFIMCTALTPVES